MNSVLLPSTPKVSTNKLVREMDATEALELGMSLSDKLHKPDGSLTDEEFKTYMTCKKLVEQMTGVPFSEHRKTHLMRQHFA